jgi:Zn-dependent protease with chaperone function
MLTPLTIAAAVLVTDVVNLVRPTPDLARRVADEPLALLPPAVLPGLAGMVLLWWVAHRFLLRDGLGGVLVTAGARPADRSDAEEHQLVNVVEELALAAGVATPRVLVLPAGVPNAAAFGRDPDHATVAVSRRLLDDLDRDATQGVVAHLVGSVANGDLRLRHSLLAVFVAYALAADLVLAPLSSRARRRLRPVLRLLRRRGSGAEAEAHAVRELLRWDDTGNALSTLTAMTWRLMQFWTNLFLVGGLLALPFRSRTYLADATAVQLTGTPDGIGRALVHLAGTAAPLPGAEWAAIYTVAGRDHVPGEDGLEDAVTLPASLRPPAHRRVRRLQHLGFRGELAGPAARPRPHPRFRQASWPVRVLVDVVALLFIVCVIAPLTLVTLGIALGGLLLSVELGLLYYAAVALAVALPPHLLLRLAG